MNTQTEVTGPANTAEALLTELDQVDEAIATANSWLATLEQRRSFLVAYLDDATRPPATAHPPATRTIHRGVQFGSELISLWGLIDIHLHVLRRLWREYPDRQDAMAHAMGLHGTSRRYVSREQGLLFMTKPDDWVRRHSVVLVEGWYADTNLSRERIRTLLPVAVRAAGLRWGDDVKILLRRTVVEIPPQRHAGAD